jgi:hypothetical protein
MGFWRGPGKHMPGNERVPRFTGHPLVRAARGARPDRNPLRRGTDRLETCLVAGLILAGAAGMPFAAQAASHASFDNAMHVRQEQLATRHPVQAVLTEDASGAGGYSLTTAVPAEATWTAADGAHRSGEVAAQSGALQGSIVTIWTDASGDPVTPPLRISEIADQADAAMVGAITGVVAGCAVGALAIRQVLNRRRMAAWEADWLATAPTWNRQR